MSELLLELPWPPSVNGYWRTFHSRQILSSAARKFRSDAAACVVMKRKQALEGRLKVRLFLYAPDRRRYDIDNRAKATLDALTHCGVWHDDSQIDELIIVRCAPIPQGKCVVEISHV